MRDWRLNNIHTKERFRTGISTERARSCTRVGRHSRASLIRIRKYREHLCTPTRTSMSGRFPSRASMGRGVTFTTQETCTEGSSNTTSRRALGHWTSGMGTCMKACGFRGRNMGRGFTSTPMVPGSKDISIGVPATGKEPFSFLMVGSMKVSGRTT